MSVKPPREERLFKARAKLLLRDLRRNPKYQSGGKNLEPWNIQATTLLTLEACRQLVTKGRPA